MMHFLNNRNLTNICFLSLAALLFSMFVNHTSALLNISAAICLLIFIFYTLFSPSKIKKNFLILWQNQRLLLCMLFCLPIWLIIPAFSFHHGFNHTALNALWNNSRYPLAFFLISLVLINHRSYIKFLNIILILILLYLVIALPIYGYLDPAYIIKINSFHKELPHLAIFIKYTILYNTIVLFPFIVCAYITKIGKKYKFLILAFMLLQYILTVYAISRGTFLAISSELITFGLIYFKFRQTKLKKVFTITIASGLIMILLLASSYTLSKRIQERVHFSQRSPDDFSNGRITIIKTSLPIFIKHMNLLTGAGYGNKTYETMLTKNNAPQKVGLITVTKHKKNFSYFHDEPQLLDIFYSGGIIGTLLFYILVFITIYKGYQYFFNDKATLINRQFALALCLSSIGYTLINGIVEHTGISIPLLIGMLLLFTLCHQDITTKLNYEKT